MGRLTERDEFGNANISGVDSMDLQCNLGFEEFNRVTKALNRLAKYEDLEEQGKLLKPPCAVGDTVWDIDFGRPCSYEVTGFSFGNLNDDWEEVFLDQIVVYYTNPSGSITGSFAADEIGKTVFLTREGAESALEEL